MHGVKKGRISESVLKRSVLKYLHNQRKEVIRGAGFDCAFLKCSSTSDGEVTAVSTQTITLPVKDAGMLAVHAAANNIAAAGAECVAAMLAITLPAEWEETGLQELMKQAEAACGYWNMQIAGGHTEVSDKVRSPVITATVLGKANENVLKQDKAKAAELDILMTKWAGLEGTMILAREKEKELLSRYPLGLLQAAQDFEKYLPIQREAAGARKSGVYTMHDMRNGGVFGGLWELSRSMGVGLSVDLKKIPIKQETIEICEFFDINPYELLSGGSLLIACEKGEALAETLAEAGIPSAVIGHTQGGNDRIIRNGDEIRFLEPAKTDEIWKAAWS